MLADLPRWVVLVAAILLCASAGAEDPPSAPPLPDDLKLVPASATAFVSVNSVDWLRTDLFRRMNKEFGTDGAVGREGATYTAAFPSKSPFGAGGLNLGLEMFIDQQELKRATVFVIAPDDDRGRGKTLEFGSIMMSAKPVDRDKLLGLLKKVEAKTYNGKTYYLQGAADNPLPATLFVSDQVIVRGSERLVRDILAERPPPKFRVLEEALQAAVAGEPLTVGVNLTSRFTDSVTAFANPRGVEPSDGAYALILTGRVDRQTDLRFRYLFTSEAAARKGVTRFKQRVTDAREWLDGFARLTPAEVNEIGRPQLTALARYAGEQMKWVGVRQDGPAVELTARLAAGEADRRWIDDLTGAWVEAVRYLRSEANLTTTNLRLMELGVALHWYHDRMGQLPPAAICDKTGQPLPSWRVAALEHLTTGRLDGGSPALAAGAALFRQFKLDEPWDGPHNRKLITKMPVVYAAIGDREKVDYAKLAADGYTFFQAAVGPGTYFERQPAEKAVYGAKGVRFPKAVDQLSKSLFVVEAADPVTQSRPAAVEVGGHRP